MLDKAGTALVVGMGLKPTHVKVLIRVGWVSIVSIHIAWVCGWLGFVGLATPFARAADVQDIQKTLRVSAEIQLQSELRAQKNMWCKNTDEKTRETIMHRIDELRRNLREIARIEDGTAEPQCYAGMPAS